MKVAQLIGRGAELVRHYTWSALRASGAKRRFGEVQCFCMFIGYPRSGHTLVGSLLDAHRHIVIALELDALRYVKFGFSRSQIFSLLVRNSEEHARQGRQWTGYSYKVPNQWQGRTEVIKIIGDKRGGDSSRRLARDFSLFERLRQTVGVPVKIVHVVRNPYDIATTMTVRGDTSTVSAAVDEYLTMVDVVERVRRQVPADCFLTIHHEQLIAQPQAEIKRLCSFLGVDAPPPYVDDCASILFASPHKTRSSIPWTKHDLMRIGRACAEHDFLRGYEFTDAPSGAAGEK
jgi:hypothetical protein